MTQRHRHGTRPVNEHSSGRITGILFRGIRRKVEYLHPLRLILVAIVVFAASMTQAQAQPAAIGMTPSHVVGLWTNVNKALVTAARLSRNDIALVRDIEAMKPNTFSGKKPGDVLGKVVEVRAKLDRFRSGSKLAPTEVYGSGEGTVNPTIVFLNSGFVLNGVVDWIARNSGPQEFVSPYYDFPGFSGKTPSDAFSMVDLADRRLALILSRS